jgi:hypothetical protein
MVIQPFDVFVRSYEDQSPIATVTITGPTTLAQLQSKVLESMPTLKNPSRLQLWFKGKKLNEPKASLAELHISAGSTI